MMRRIISFCTLLILTGFAWQTFGQTNITPAQRLRLARATYEAGRLHELVGTILGGPEADICFNPKEGQTGFSLQEKVDALKLLVLANIYLENPTEADNKMLELLRADHFYKPDPSSDPAEYLALYSTFRTDPVLSISGRFGGTLTLPTLLTIYTATPFVNGKFTPGVSWQASLAVEKEFFSKSKSFLKNTELIGDIMYVSRTFSQKDEELYFNTPSNLLAGRNEYKSKSSWLDLNVLLKYRLKKDSKIDPYVGAGYGLSMLLTYDIDLIQTQRFRGDDGTTLTATVTGPSIEMSDSFHTFANTVTALGGIKTKLGAIYLLFEGRAQFGLNNLIKVESRTNQELVMDYHKQLNDYRQSNFSINIGVTYPYFKPKKLSRKK